MHYFYSASYKAVGIVVVYLTFKYLVGQARSNEYLSQWFDMGDAQHGIIR